MMYLRLWGLRHPRVDTAGMRGWKPVSLNTSFLASVCVISLALAALLQYLLFLSTRNNGLIFAADIHNLALGQAFAYLYLPTILTVCYGFFWAWIDLDIRRLEPWYQVAARDGALGKESLLLDYPVQFILAVPFTAIRHR